MRTLKIVFAFLFLLTFSSLKAESLEGVDFDAIYSRDKQQTVEYVRAFPFDDYKIYYCKQPGYFYIDMIEDILKNKLRHGEAWAPEMSEHIYRYARMGSVVVDVGAHIGTYTLTLSRTVGMEGRVIAIEPQPKMFRELMLNMALNQAGNVDFYLAGVGDRVGEIELMPPVEGSEGARALGGGSGEHAQLITLDSLNLDNVSLIKIDAEWMENAVLDGAKQTIARSRPVILIEIMGGFEFETAPPRVQARIAGTLKKLESLGYTTQRLSSHDYLALPLY